MRLPDERWQHAVDRHPNLVLERDRVIETARWPDTVHLGDAGEWLASRRSIAPPFDGKHLVVVYLEEGKRCGFIATAYSTGHLATGRPKLWDRPP